jgi:hypothetical protein
LRAKAKVSFLLIVVLPTDPRMGTAQVRVRTLPLHGNLISTCTQYKIRSNETVSATTVLGEDLNDNSDNEIDSDEVNSWE